MTTKEEFIQIARSFAGTPFQHQGHIKHVVIDCAGFIAEVARESGAVPDVNFEQNYRRQENGAQMLSLLRDYMDFVEGEAEIGDVLALCDEHLRHTDVPRHLMILTEKEPYWKAIHASERGVLEHRLDARFKRRIHSAWRLRNLSG
jgi:cell wall-associated NlpC family hydrolase